MFILCTLSVDNKLSLSLFTQYSIFVEDITLQSNLRLLHNSNLDRQWRDTCFER